MIHHFNTSDKCQYKNVPQNTVNEVYALELNYLIVLHGLGLLGCITLNSQYL